MKSPGQFGHDYAKAIQDACFKAVIEASIDPATNTAMLRSSEITRTKLQIKVPASSPPAGIFFDQMQPSKLGHWQPEDGRVGFLTRNSLRGSL